MNVVNPENGSYSLRCPGIILPPRPHCGRHSRNQPMIQTETLSFDCIVDGEAVTGARLDVVNPATGLVFASCSVADEALVDRAVAGAARAQRDWAVSGLDERRADREWAVEGKRVSVRGKIG